MNERRTHRVHAPRHRRGNGYGAAEALCWLLAVVLCAPLLAGVAGRAALQRAVPDQDWSASRRAEFHRFSRLGAPAPIGYLAVPDQDLRLPVFSGTGEAGLTLGAGHLPDTSPLDGDGNVAIAGHRDGFFRRLRHVEAGDVLILGGQEGPRRYRVTETLVVAPEDVWVLDDTGQPTLTLITCHPFYFAGNAPNRFIVRATELGPPGLPGDAVTMKTTDRADLAATGG